MNKFGGISRAVFTQRKSAFGRLMRIMSRPHQPTDDADYQACRAIIMSYGEAQPDYRPNAERNGSRSESDCRAKLGDLESKHG